MRTHSSSFQSWRMNFRTWRSAPFGTPSKKSQASKPQRPAAPAARRPVVGRADPVLHARLRGPLRRRRRLRPRSRDLAVPEPEVVTAERDAPATLPSPGRPAVCRYRAPKARYRLRQDLPCGIPNKSLTAPSHWGFTPSASQPRRTVRQGVCQRSMGGPALAGIAKTFRQDLSTMDFATLTSPRRRCENTRSSGRRLGRGDQGCDRAPEPMVTVLVSNWREDRDGRLTPGDMTIALRRFPENCRACRSPDVMGNPPLSRVLYLGTFWGHTHRTTDHDRRVTRCPRSCG